MERKLLLLLAGLWCATGLVVFNTQDMRLTGFGRISSSILSFGECKNILVLGAGRIYSWDRPNYAFIGRADAAARYSSFHPDNLVILSGYYDGNHYNEAIDMLQAMRLRGVTPAKYVIDSESPDTFHSLVRYKARYSSEPVVLISQPEHLCRAVWMARQLHIDAYGFVAGGYNGKSPEWIIHREYAAAVKARLRFWHLLPKT